MIGRMPRPFVSGTPLTGATLKTDSVLCFSSALFLTKNIPPIPEGGAKMNGKRYFAIKAFQTRLISHAISIDNQPFQQRAYVPDDSAWRLAIWETYAGGLRKR